MASFSMHIIYIFFFSWYQATATQVQGLATDDTAYKTPKLSFIEQLLKNLSYTQNNRVDDSWYSTEFLRSQSPTFDPNSNWNLDKWDESRVDDSRYSKDFLRPLPTTIGPNSDWDWEWDESNKSNLITSTMIAVAIALIVLIKLTLIALMVRRGRRLQRMTVISSNHTSIPNEFDINDSAHLVTPATIMYVEPQDLYNDNGVPSIPCSSGTPGLALMTPPPYSEASPSLQQVEAPKDDYPPPAYQESQDA